MDLELSLDRPLNPWLQMTDVHALERLELEKEH